MPKKIEKNKDISKIIFKKGELVKEVESLCSENLFGCYQCGTCSAGCPYVDEMDLTPDEVIRYVILDRSEVLSSKTIWLCSACFTCASAASTSSFLDPSSTRSSCCMAASY